MPSPSRSTAVECSRYVVGEEASRLYLGSCPANDFPVSALRVGGPRADIDTGLDERMSGGGFCRGDRPGLWHGSRGYERRRYLRLSPSAPTLPNARLGGET
jgi:hypothetical protein